jgi:5-methylcytosine-specific restriction endonuclease McrA
LKNIRESFETLKHRMKKKKKQEPLWCELYRDKVIKPQQRKRFTEKAGRTKESQEGFYNKREWKVLRDRRRRENPICQRHEKKGIIKPMQVVDHIIPVDEAPELALEFTNTQSLCAFCHTLKTNQDKKDKAKRKRLERGKRIMAELERKWKEGGG